MGLSKSRKLIFALMISQAIQLYVASDGDEEVRLMMNSWYGSFVKAMYTMFEITYSGGEEPKEENHAHP